MIADPNGRLKNLRELHGMTQKHFATELGIGQAQLSQIESGVRGVTDTTISAARYRFGVGRDFFAAPSIRYTDRDLNYRTKQLSVRERRIANVTFGLIEQAVRDQAPTAAVIPTLGIVRDDTTLHRSEIEAYAEAARDIIGIRRDKVINNVIRCVERVGVLATGLGMPEGSQRIDGISTPWRSDQPFVMALDLVKPGDRLRFSIAHEFGHILLHTDRRPEDDKVRETEADMFASAFLLPKAPMLDELAPDLTLSGYTRVKARWGASIQAIIRRAYDLEVIDHERYRSLSIQLSSRGWRTKEPVLIPKEDPAIPTPILFSVSDPGSAHERRAGNVIDLFGTRAPRAGA